MEKIYNKLVRDFIPEIITADNGNPITKILNDEEYKSELENKLLEEYNEFLKSQSTKNRIEELADMLEVMRSLAKLENKNLDDIIKIANIKKLKRGGFDKKIFLEKSIEED